MLKLNVAFAPAGQDESVEGSGVTENVSAGGLYFRTSDWQALEKGGTLVLRVSGLHHYDHGPLTRLVTGRATVVRLDAAEPVGGAQGGQGVAVRFNEPPRVEVPGPTA